MPRSKPKATRPAPPVSRRRSLVPVALLAAALSAAGVAWWWSARTAATLPPPIETMGEMDPDVASLLRELRAAIAASPDEAGRWGRFGMAAEANGFAGAARDAYALATARAPEDPRWWYRLALVRARLGEADPARDALARTIALAPGYAPAWVRRGQWLLDAGDPAEAEAAFRRAAELDPDNPAAPIGLARIQLERRQEAQAAETLERLLERHPGERHALQLLGAAYRRLGRLEDAEFALAVGAVDASAGPDPWSDEVGEYRRGFAAMLKAATQEAMAGRPDRAIPLLAELRRQRPADVALANHFADVLVAAGRAGEAVQLLRSMVEAGAANAETHLTLASALLASGDLAAADDRAGRAAALGARGARAFELQGAIAWRRGRRAEAVRLLEEGIARDPRNVRLPTWIGFIRLEENRPADARARFGDALRREPMHAEALAGFAIAQSALGAREEAAIALARAEQIAPDHPRVREARLKVKP